VITYFVIICLLFLCRQVPNDLQYLILVCFILGSVSLYPKVITLSGYSCIWIIIYQMFVRTSLMLLIVNVIRFNWYNLLNFIVKLLLLLQNAIVWLMRSEMTWNKVITLALKFFEFC
jgi:hypothetical protein